MDSERLMSRLRKVLALTGSPVEGEAQAAAAMLQKLLTDHNLSIADLEKRGVQGRPGIRETPHDLGKAAFKWKLNLAEAIAEFYFCVSLVDHKAKTVAFVGRPDNVDALQMLYRWVIAQIADIARAERRNHFIRTNEEIDPLRWQVNFGLGAVSRLRERLAELKERQAENVHTQALVVHHAAEISDYLEATYGYRVDGRMTKLQEQREREWQDYLARNRKETEEREALRINDPEEYARRYPWDTDEARAERAADDLRAMRKYNAKERRRERERERRRENGTASNYRPISEKREREQDQAWSARRSGRSGADQVNLQPFLDAGKQQVK